MRINTWVLLFVSAAVATSLVGCGTTSTTAVQNEPPSTTASAVSLKFQPAPPTSVFLDTTANLSAVVSNDPSNLGVSWTLQCPVVNACGSLSVPHTASGQPVTYTPPASLSTNSQSYKIVAYATADQSKNLITSITVKAFAGTLKGPYVIHGSGVYADPTTGDSGTYNFAGVVILDGNGGVQGGEQSYSAYSVANATSFSVTDTISGGNYFLGPDGRGTLSIQTTDQNIGQNGSELFSVAVLSSSQAFIAKIPDTNSQSTRIESSTGTMDRQTSIAAPIAGWAFVVTGTDIATASPTGVGGVLNIDSPNTISGNGSISDQDLPVFPPVISNAPISGTVTAPDHFGMVQFNLSTLFSTAPMVFTGYIVDNSHIKLVETDADSVNLTGAVTSGVAVGQGAATGTFKTKASFQGNYTFGILGEDAGGGASSLTSAGTFTVTSTGSLSPGFNEVYFGGLFVNVTDQFHAPCKYDIQGKTGRVDCFLTYKHVNINGTGPEFIFYQTGNGNPPLLLDADSDLPGGAGVGIGYAYLAPSTFTLSGDYGVRLTQTTFGSEDDISGQFIVNSAAQTLSGTVDTNFEFTSTFPASITGTFAPGTTPDLLNGTISNQFLLPNDITVDYYLTDPSHGFFIENDFLQTGSLAFGYFSSRTPVCQGCP